MIFNVVFFCFCNMIYDIYIKSLVMGISFIINIGYVVYLIFFLFLYNILYFRKYNNINNVFLIRFFWGIKVIFI